MMDWIYDLRDRLDKATAERDRLRELATELAKELEYALAASMITTEAEALLAKARAMGVLK